MQLILSSSIDLSMTSPANLQDNTKNPAGNEDISMDRSCPGGDDSSLEDDEQTQQQQQGKRMQEPPTDSKIQKEEFQFSTPPRPIARVASVSAPTSVQRGTSITTATSFPPPPQQSLHMPPLHPHGGVHHLHTPPHPSYYWPQQHPAHPSAHATNYPHYFHNHNAGGAAADPRYYSSCRSYPAIHAWVCPRCQLANSDQYRVCQYCQPANSSPHSNLPFRSADDPSPFKMDDDDLNEPYPLEAYEASQRSNWDNARRHSSSSGSAPNNQNNNGPTDIPLSLLGEDAIASAAANNNNDTTDPVPLSCETAPPADYDLSFLMKEDAFDSDEQDFSSGNDGGDPMLLAGNDSGSLEEPSSPVPYTGQPTNAEELADDQPELDEKHSAAITHLESINLNMCYQDGTPVPEYRYLIFPEDKTLLTDYFYFIMKQLRHCQFTERDRKTRGGKRESIPVGFSGLQCVHCANIPKKNHYPRKFFWAHVDRLANSFAEIPSHILKCRGCPKETQEALLVLKAKHAEQMSRLPRGSQKDYFRRMWKRIHDFSPQAPHSPARLSPQPQNQSNRQSHHYLSNRATPSLTASPTSTRSNTTATTTTSKPPPTTRVTRRTRGNRNHSAGDSE